MKVGWLEAPGVGTYITRRHTQRTAQGDAEMRKITAHPCSLGDSVIGRGERVRGAADIVDVVVNPIANLDDALISHRQLTECALREAVEAVRLAIPAWVEVGQHTERKLGRRNLKYGCGIFGRMAQIQRRLIDDFEPAG